MENASKALLIAGAILLAILIIGLGVFIYNQASNTVSETGMDQIAVRQFNAQFEPYIGTNVSGITALSLYDAVQSYNATAERGRLVTLNLVRVEHVKKSVDMLRVKAMAAEEAEEIVGFEDLVKEEGITFNKSELSATKKYNIEVAEYDGGTIKVINIRLASDGLIIDKPAAAEACK